MKLRELDVENFGIFSHQQFEFPGDRLQVVYGPNESGKTTLLELIREVLFRFEPRNPYAFATHDGEMAATVLAEMQDGVEIRFRRRKGTKNTVNGEILGSGQSFDAPGLMQLLGGANLQLFKSVFGFSVTELAEGESNLKDANVGEALFGSAMGGLADLRSLIGGLEKQAGDLFAPTAKKRPINRLLTSIGNQEKKLRKAQIRPSFYEQRRKEVDELKGEAEQLREHRAVLQREKELAERLVDAIDIWDKRNRLLEEIDTLKVPDGFPLDGGDQYRRAKNGVGEYRNELKSFQDELESNNDELKGLKLHPDIVARGSEIQELQEKLGLIRGFRRDVELRYRDAETTRDTVKSQLRALDPSWDLEQLDVFKVDAAQRADIKQLERDYDELKRQHSERRLKLIEVEKGIESLEKQLKRLGETSEEPLLEELLNKSSEYQANLQGLAKLVQEQQSETASIEAMVTKLNAPFGNKLSEIHRLPVPIVAAVKDLQQRWDEAERKAASAQDLLNERKKAVRKRQRELKKLSAADAIPDREQLNAARAHRDEGWGLVRERFVEGKTLSKDVTEKWGVDTLKSLPDAFEESVREADELADVRQDKAELVARKEQLQAELDQEQEQVEELSVARDECVVECDAISQEWMTMWEPSGFVPETPEAMLSWLRAHAELVDAVSTSDRVQSQIESLKQSAHDFEAELRGAVGEPIESSSELLAAARARLKRAVETVSERKAILRDLNEKRDLCDVLRQQLATIEKDQAGWLGLWEPLMEQCGFPTGWSVYAANEVLDGLSDARQNYEKAESLEQRVAEMRDGVNEFERAVETLVNGLNCELDDAVAENTVEELVRMLEEAKQSARTHEKLTTGRATLENRILAKERQVAEVESVLVKLLSLAGVDEDDELLTIAKRVRYRREQVDEVDKLERQLRAIQGAQDKGEFEAALETTDKYECNARLEELKARLNQIEEQHTKAANHAAIAARELEEMVKSSEAANLAIDLESQREELRTAIDQWAPLVLAQSFLRQALVKFENENQPRLLEEAARLFGSMTHGRYVAISRKLDEDGTLRLEQKDGSVKEPHQLSTGTREQLYLAIRLAYILQYCTETEPLPLIMDDVLVNFDNDRARNTLETLTSVAEQVQVILLTCHENTLDLARSADSTIEPITLAS